MSGILAVAKVSELPTRGVYTSIAVTGLYGVLLGAMNIYKVPLRKVLMRLYSLAAI